MIGQGWSIDSRRSGSLALNLPDRKSLPITILEVHREMRTSRGPVRVPELMAYCFVGGEELTGSYPGFIAADAWNRVVLGKADRWAYVLLETGAGDGADRALERMHSILEGLGPSLFRPHSSAR